MSYRNGAGGVASFPMRGQGYQGRVRLLVRLVIKQTRCILLSFSGCCEGERREGDRVVVGVGGGEAGGLW